MHRVISCITQQHDWQFLTLAAMVCGLSVIISLHIHTFAGNLRAPVKIAWRTAAGATSGFGLWAAHFIMLMGLQSGIELTSQLSVPLLTLLGSLVMTTLGFLVLGGARPWHALGAGILIALGIEQAQFADMYALVERGAVAAPADGWTLLAGAVVPLVLTTLLTAGAMLVYAYLEGQRGRWLAGIILGTAVAVAHYTAMAGAGFCASDIAAKAGSVTHATPTDSSALALLVGALSAFAALAAGLAAIYIARSRRPARPADRTDGETGGITATEATPVTRMRRALASPQVLLRNPIIGFAIALIAVVWLVTFWQRATEREVDLNDVTNDAANIARFISQNVERTASNLDITLKYIRRSYERSGYEASWPSLISDEYTNSNLTVQIAFIDAHGMMVSSSAMLYPAKPIDLSDREHFKALVATSGDPLYISRPMVGRASGLRTVQFARRIFTKERDFAGILVASLTSDYLAKAFGSVTIGNKSGIALYGEDGIIRAGIGIFAQAVEQRIDDIAIDGFESIAQAATRATVTTSNGIKALAARPVAGYPLAVRVVLQDEKGEVKAATRGWLYFTGALIATILVAYVAITSVYNRETYEARIVRLAHYDPLTGVPNRAHFKGALEQSYRQLDASNKFALLLIDLDGFKIVNDQHGHPIGDQLLKAVAQRIKQTLRSYDTLARLGGDEFAVIQTRPKGPEDAATLAGRLCQLMAQPFEINGFTISIGASIGIALSTDAASGPELMKATDLALYEAKMAGRGQYQFYAHDLGTAFQARCAMERDLKAALAAQQFQLHYQPIIDIASGQVSGYEALVRWFHPKKGFIPPNDFIPIAEDTGLIVPLGQWILRRACADIAMCDPSLTIAVNCSTLQVKSVNFVESVKAALEDTGLSPYRLELEITESILMTKDSATLERMKSLRELGVGLSLDDFGTGYSSLSYVMSYPFTKLKVDRSFTSQICEDIRGASVVRAICALAGTLGMKTVAEGVETSQQVEALRALGCEAAQGYYFSRPKPADEILVRIAADALTPQPPERQSAA